MRLIRTVSVLCLLFGITMTVWSEAQQEESTMPQVTWKLAGVHAVTTPETKGLNYFAELVGEMSDGNFTIQVFPAGQLGKDAVVMVENLEIGSIEVFGNVMDWNQHLVQDYGILAMPFVFENVDDVKEFQQGSIYREMGERMISERGVRIIADNWYRLPKVLLANRRITSLEDIQGMTLRMPSLVTYFDTWKALGASPTVIPWAEAFLALERGVVDGLDSPLGSIYGMKFYQAAPNIMMTNHLLAPVNILVNEDKFQQLPESYQEILIEAGRQAGDYYTDLVISDFEVDQAQMESEGAQFWDIDTAPFIEAAAGVARRFEEEGMWRSGLFEEITTN